MPKHRRTILREAAQKLHSVDRDDFLDAMLVLEESMRRVSCLQSTSDSKSVLRTAGIAKANKGKP